MSAFLQGLKETAAPVVAVAALVIWLPRRLVPAGCVSQGRVALAMAETALAALVFGAVLFAVLYAQLNPGAWGEFLAAPAERAGFYLGRSALMAMLWAPLLAFVWLGAAQRVEAAKSAERTREGRG